jgi:hypothetical protein
MEGGERGPMKEWRAPSFLKLTCVALELARGPEGGGVTAGWEHLADALLSFAIISLLVRCSLGGLFCHAYILCCLYFF